MNVEKIDRVAIHVNNLDEAMRMFSDLLGIEFDVVPREGIKRTKTITEHADRAFEEAKNKIALSPVGLELVESAAVKQEGLRSFHLKVSDIEAAKAEMKAKGIRLVADMAAGGLKEAIYSPEDLHGVRLVLVEYDAPTALKAIMQK